MAGSFSSDITTSIDRNVFVMMKYRDDDAYQQIEHIVRTRLASYGLVARLAKDREYFPDLWANIVHCIKHCQYGLAIFEEIESRDFNPNISLELGYMYALERRCLLLKDRRMPQLPTDICGRIYRNFDTYKLTSSLSTQIDNWCEKDLLLTKVDLATIGSETEREPLLYELADTQDKARRISYYKSPLDVTNLRRLPDDPNRVAIELQSLTAMAVGVNISLPTLSGIAKFQYQVISANTAETVYFALIPMQETGVGRSGLIEVGSEREDHPRNATSKHRLRLTVPKEHFADGKWHTATMEWNFRSLPQAFYTMFAPRINEGCKSKGTAHLLVSNLRVHSRAHVANALDFSSRVDA